MKKSRIKKYLVIALLLFLALGIFALIKHKNEKVINCQNLNTQSLKEQCWQNTVNSILENKGIDAAFDALVKINSDDPSFKRSCHGIAHQLGARAYLLFSQKKEFTFSKRSQYCSFGFYHAFMQALVHDKGFDVMAARSFCDKAKMQLGKTVPDVLGACYHGIGHGAIDDDGTVQWKDEKSKIEDVLIFCKNVSQTGNLLYRCSSGIFNVMAIAYSEKRLQINKNNPISYCQTLENKIYRQACFDEMNTFLVRFSGKDLARGIQYLEKIDDISERKSATRSLSQAFSAVEISSKNYENIADACRRSGEVVKLNCFFGFAAGLIEAGGPETEYVSGLEFCTTGFLKRDERQACFDGILWYLQRLYPPEKVENICAKTDQKFRNYCVVKSETISLYQ